VRHKLNYWQTIPKRTIRLSFDWSIMLLWFIQSALCARFAPVGAITYGHCFKIEWIRTKVAHLYFMLLSERD